MDRQTSVKTLPSLGKIAYITDRIRRIGESNVLTRVCPSIRPSICLSPPPPGLATRRSVCLLRSRRRTFLFLIKI